jgi:hypothetical protein
MPVFRNRAVFAIARNLSAFLNLEAGVVRGQVPAQQNGRDPALEEELRKARQQLKSRDHRIAVLEKLAEQGGWGSGTSTLDPAKLIWIFGTTRTGSTWLASMMADLEDHAMWNEPMVGRLFGAFYNSARPGEHVGQQDSDTFIMGNPTKDGWIRSVRSFVLDGASYCNPELDESNYLVIKEPNGSVGAGLILQALPESRNIFLVRDPRDVMASRLDAVKKGSWLREREDKARPGGIQGKLADEDPDQLIRNRSTIYLQQMTQAREAYEAHRGPKSLIRYEDLRADTLGTMKRIYSELGIPVDEAELVRVVEKHSWENIPEDQKGEGKVFRKGQPGSWREDLSPEQVKIVEQITAPLLKEFYAEPA